MVLNVYFIVVQFIYGRDVERKLIIHKIFSVKKRDTNIGALASRRVKLAIIVVGQLNFYIAVIV